MSRSPREAPRRRDRTAQLVADDRQGHPRPREHEDTRAAARQAYVVIEWSGSLRIGNGPVQPITGRATTTGDPVAVQVKTARSKLVAD